MRYISEKLFVITIAFTLLSSCSSRGVAPVDSRATDGAYRAAPVSGNPYAPQPVTTGFYQVVRGDTLYSISWRYGFDYRDVARWNNIPNPYIIYPGQRIRLTPDNLPVPASASQGASTRPAQIPSAQNQPEFISTLPTPTDTARPAPPPPQRTTPAPPVTTSLGPINWRWPTTGNIVRTNTPIAQKGLDISGREGQDINAAADGVVVYSGSGLLGYGKLIIIKHNDTYLSAYAHNQVIQVNEGDMVKVGQKIGTMGRGNRGEPLLHFEIRRDGQPVDPLQYLPTRS
jgi:lipoprotein NlpD